MFNEWLNLIATRPWGEIMIFVLRFPTVILCDKSCSNCNNNNQSCVPEDSTLSLDACIIMEAIQSVLNKSIEEKTEMLEILNVCSKCATKL